MAVLPAALTSQTRWARLCPACHVPRKFRHCQGYSGMRWIFAKKLRYSATVTCADGHGWLRTAGLCALHLLAGHGSGAATKLEARGQGLKVPQVGLAQGTSAVDVAGHAALGEVRAEEVRAGEVNLLNIAVWMRCLITVRAA